MEPDSKAYMEMMDELFDEKFEKARKERKRKEEMKKILSFYGKNKAFF